MGVTNKSFSVAGAAKRAANHASRAAAFLNRQRLALLGSSDTHTHTHAMSAG